ncbi:IST1 homolog [Pelobates fuscus]|uniref:IST1 homolog n=1 Tax=Pelobates fuscus TaxID=191477 RepID=UPI002FE4CF86
MLGSGFKADRLKINLRLAMNRLKLLEKKKTEIAQKARKEIADYLSSKKFDRARIRVEHIIQEDNLVEAMEILEMFCDLLLARFGLIQCMKQVDPGLSEAISSLIWAAPRLMEVTELKTVASQLSNKYSKEYGNLCRTNEIKTVSERLMKKLNTAAPPRILVEKYLIEIAKQYNVQFEPDLTALAEVPPEDNHDKKTGGPGNGGFGCPYPQNSELDDPVGVYEQCAFLQPPPRPHIPPSIPDNPPAYDMAKPPPGLVGEPRLYPKPDYGGDSNSQDKWQQRDVRDRYNHMPLPKLPSAPADPPATNPSPYEDIDFEDLSKRLDDLKKKT